MKSKDRNDSSSETPKDDASQEHKRKQRIAKKGWNPPPFDAFSEADKSRPRNAGRPGGRPAGRPSADKPAFGDKPKRTFGDKPAFGDRPKRTFNRDEAGGAERPKRTYGDKPAFGDKPKRTFGDKPVFGDKPKRTFNRDEAGGAERPKRTFGDKPAFGDRPKRTFNRDEAGGAERPKRTYGDKPAFGDRPKRTYGDKPAFGDRPKRPFNRDDSRGGPSDEPRRKFGRGGVPTEGADSQRRPFNRDEAGGAERPKRTYGDKPAFGDKPKRTFGDKPAFGDRPKRTFGDKPAFGDRPQRPGFGAAKPGTRKPFDRTERSASSDRPARKPFDRTERSGGNDRPVRKSARDSFKGYGPKGIRSRDDEPPRGGKAEPKAKVEEVRLNKYIAHSGVCARREADTLIEMGKVKVNGKVVTELGTKVKTTDKVVVNDMAIQFEPYKYVLMHKPKNTITTTSDERGRKTVMDLIENEIGERLYPIGRLDRNTTGVLLLTNDGDLANRLMHPSYTIGKVYQAEVNRVLTDDELDQLRKGIELEDGPARAYNVVRGSLDPYSIELSVHEGRNHLVRRMVEALGAEVIRLKRSEFAGLDLDDLRPGRWRFLKTREVSTLRTKVKLPDLRK